MTESTALGRVRQALAAARDGLVARDVLVELVLLAAVAEEHLLIIGPPGTAKSLAARRAAQVFEARYFEYLLGRFTEPSEIFGPVDLRKLREGVVETEVGGMLPEADIAFLDEVFLGSSAILNTLLGLLNERTFRRGKSQLQVPLRVCVGASNALPTEDALAAFADRFLLRTFVEPLPDALLEDLLGARPKRPVAVASIDDLDVLARAADGADLSGIRPLYAQCVRLLRQAGVELTDRRLVRVQRLIAAAATLAGRSRAEAEDLWPLVFALPTAEQQALARTVLKQQLEGAANDATPGAALEATQGRAARAKLLDDRAAQLLVAEVRDDRWRLQLEGVARDIDAAFSSDTLPDSLKSRRALIVDALA
ncbi:MAG: AAA family ATPase [Myxococcaceae bacterium]